jgi:pilus assembly protein FimV
MLRILLEEEIPPVAAAPEELKAPEEPKAEAVPPKEEVAQEIPPPAEAMPEGKFGPPDVATGMAPEESGTPMVEPLEAAPTAETAPETPPTAEPEAAPALAQMTDYHVQRGDTLWRIAEKARADDRDVSIEQMILAIYRTNQDAFFGNNVNNLKAGKILKMPERAEVESTTTSDARREFRAQYSAWQEYKLRLASASGAVQVPEAPEEPAPAPAPEPAKEAAKPPKAATTATDRFKQDELLKIVRSTLQQEKSTPDQKVAEKESAQETAAREQQALADRAATLEESLESKRLENKELSDKVGVVRSQLSKESRLIELESQDLAQQPKPAEPKPVEPAAKPVEPASPPAEKTVTAPAPEQKGPGGTAAAGQARPRGAQEGAGAARAAAGKGLPCHGTGGGTKRSAGAGRDRHRGAAQRRHRAGLLPPAPEVHRRVRGKHSLGRRHQHRIAGDHRHRRGPAGGGRHHRRRYLVPQRLQPGRDGQHPYRRGRSDRRGRGLSGLRT